ncbi:MAG TPA: hypothetical protein VJL39_01250 [Candidatus Paceibacterota bacterium]
MGLSQWFSLHNIPPLYFRKGGIYSRQSIREVAMQEHALTGTLRFRGFNSSLIVLDDESEVPLEHLFDSLFERLDGRPSKHTYLEGIVPTTALVVDESSIYYFDRESGWLIDRGRDGRKTYNMYGILRTDFSLRHGKRVTVTFTEEGVTIAGECR